MENTTTTATDMGDSTKRATGGRKPFWGEPSIRTQVYMPAWLIARIEKEALARNDRLGKASVWNFSKVAAEALLEKFGK